METKCAGICGGKSKIGQAVGKSERGTIRIVGIRPIVSAAMTPEPTLFFPEPATRITCFPI